MLLLVEKGISHCKEDFSLRMSSFSPLLSFLPPTRSDMTPKRKTAMVFFASSSILMPPYVIFKEKYRKPR